MMFNSKNEEIISDPWMYYMKKGEFESAWKISDQILLSRLGKTCWHLPRHFQYVWNGTPLEDKHVLVRCYHGLGDTIHFIRYAPLIKRIAKELIVWVQPELIPLLETMKNIDKLLSLHNGAPEVEYDVDVEIMELPHVFRTTIKTIPAEVPYFNVNPFFFDKKNLNVGLIWKSGDWDEKRSIPYPLIERFAEIPGINFYILQRGSGLSEWNENFGTLSGSNDILELAQIIKGLDLVISVDTMIAHLAGALAVPVWILLHANADWRWMKDRDDNPWYPTMRLFRQQKIGEWEAVIKKIINELKSLRSIR